MLESKICKYCNQEYFKKSAESRSVWTRKKYCSCDCANAAKNQKVKLGCEQCGKEFFRKPSQVRRSKFCSLACKHASQRKGSELICEYCNRTYYRKAYQVKASHFCSQTCQWAAKRATLKCEVCHKEFILPRNQAKKRRFCSRKCHKTWQASLSVELICKHCSKPFRVKPSHVSKRRFCSYSCRGIAECAKYLEEYRYTSEDLKQRWRDPEYRARMTAMAQGKNNPMYGRPCPLDAGAFKWYNYERPCGQIVRLQASFELRMAKALDKLGWPWQVHGEIKRLPYVLNGRQGTYSPDFYLPGLDLYIDTKGFFRKSDQNKIKAVRHCNPEIHLLIATKPILLMYEHYAENQG